MNSTNITIILDRSGSMESCKNDMQGGLRSFIDEQKKTATEYPTVVNFVQFDSEYEQVFMNRKLEEIVTNDIELVPRGMTALNDAIGRTINSVGQTLRSMKEEDRPSKVIFMIVTDGLENSSYEFTSEQVREMVKHQKDKYSWEFMFLGADIDAIATANVFGISANNAAQYDKVSAPKMFGNLSGKLGAIRSMVTNKADAVEISAVAAFSDEDRKEYVENSN